MLNISFCGLKDNIKYGKRAISSIRREFPNGIMSNTNYKTFSGVVDNQTLRNYEGLVTITRDIFDKETRYGKTKLEAAKIAVHKTHAGNCAEQSFLVCDKLKEMGIKPKIVEMDVLTKGFPRKFVDGHVFCVIDTDDGFIASDPKTWGDDSVVVDLWANIVSKSQDAIDFFKTFLKPKHNEMYFFRDIDEF